MKLIKTMLKDGDTFFVNPELVQAFNATTGQLYLNGAGVTIDRDHKDTFRFELMRAAKAEEAQ